MNMTNKQRTTKYERVTEYNASGVWTNELGSEVRIEVDKQTGLMTGEYVTKVGDAPPTPFPLTGWTSPDGSHPSVSFSVLWNGGTSTTAWAGLLLTCDGRETLKTTWLLVSETDCDNSWGDTQVGCDDFTRVTIEPPSEGVHSNDKEDL